MSFEEKTYPADGPVTLSANITEFPTTRALMAGEIASDLVTFDFAGLKNAHAGFKDMLRRGKYDISEMAIATFLQAHEFDKPFSLLPLVVLGRFQHQCIGYNTDVHPELAPGDLEGKTVGVRSYTQTTGLWVRGILQNDYGVDPDKVNWLCFDQPHLEEYTDPASVSWGEDGKDPVNMLLAGELDAAVLGMNMPKDPRIKTLIPNPQEAAKDWYARNTLVPPNHYLIVPNALCDQRPDVVREIWRMVVECRKLAPAAQDGIDAWPVGIEANRPALECAVKYASQQHMISKPVDIEDLFHPLLREIAA
ncbi:phosphate ABC transporter substrate-binding protein [Martelella mediterranea]|uniref:phosphate ABC transporter substrate-binding protein n=1 Tax=Martelella mediterranea TaxID=293089 RepID=UPI001E33E247|nr:phosphate ABC transporter substrate-binding protein [Martelella mediterranea]MCD1636893.1 phosphate ABC transporter substrate-binding protein [Martelella mediterranea]